MTNKFDKYIVGGSFGFQNVYEKYRRIEYNDIDVFISTCDVQKTLNTINELWPDIKKTIKYSHEVSTNDTNVEAFNQSIACTITIIDSDISKKNIQLVLINQPNDNLVNWYKNTTDLPVFLHISKSLNNNMYHRGNELYYTINIKDELVYNLAMEKILYGIKHQSRKDKYNSKEFHYID
jgi:hypothetical protein